MLNKFWQYEVVYEQLLYFDDIGLLAKQCMFEKWSQDTHIKLCTISWNDTIWYVSWDDSVLFNPLEVHVML